MFIRTFRSQESLDHRLILLEYQFQNLSSSLQCLICSGRHLANLPLADPNFGEPGLIDLLHGVDLFVEVLINGWRTGPPGAPVPLETEFGWVLCGSTDHGTHAVPDQVNTHATAFHASTTHMSGDDIIRQFWEIEKSVLNIPALSFEKRAVVQHFEAHHHRTLEGRFIVPSLKKTDAGVIGKSRSQAVH